MDKFFNDIYKQKPYLCQEIKHFIIFKFGIFPFVIKKGSRYQGVISKWEDQGVLLASNPGIVLTRTQIFEAVWNMDSDSCQSSISTVIYNLRKKIEPDSKNPTYIKTVLGVGYKFDVKSARE